MKKTGIKKTIAFICAVSIVCAVFGITAAFNHKSEPVKSVFAANEQQILTLQIGNPNMTVNGTSIEIDPGEGTTPIIQNERTLLPIRAIVEEIGGSVEWNNDTREVTLDYAGDEIKLTIDSTTAYLNGNEQILDTAPAIINERTMLPIRFIAESFDFNVGWEQSTQTVTITKEETSEPTVTPATTVTPTPTTEVQPATQPEKVESKTAVIYFSVTGNTKSLAEKIASASDGDIYEILPQVAYTSDDLNYNNAGSRANTEINTDARPEIQEFNVDLLQYDTIILGYPIWWGTCPPVIKTFLDTYDLSGKTIMPFCTSGSSGISTSATFIEGEEESADVKEGMRGTAQTTEEQINTWLNSNGFTK